MKILVEYTAQLRNQAKCSEESFELEPAAGLAALFQAIAERHGPAMRELLFDREGQPAPSLLCFVGEEQVDWSQPPALSEGVRVMLLSPISGG